MLCDVRNWQLRLTTTMALQEARRRKEARGRKRKDEHKI
jgi:hypothetical protein